MGKNIMKGFVIGVVFTIIATLTIPVLAKSAVESIQVTYKNISIFIDGENKTPQQEPFIYGGTTYVPLRFVSEALGKEINWDAANNSIYIGQMPVDTKDVAINGQNENDRLKNISGSYVNLYSTDLSGSSLQINHLGDNRFSFEGNAFWANDYSAMEAGRVNVGDISGSSEIVNGEATYVDELDNSITFNFFLNGLVHVEENTPGAFGGMNVSFYGLYGKTASSETGFISYDKALSSLKNSMYDATVTVLTEEVGPVIIHDNPYYVFGIYIENTSYEERFALFVVDAYTGGVMEIDEDGNLAHG